MKVAVLGSGGWGTALALLLLENGHDVTLWSYMEAESAALREKRENPVLPGVALPEELKLTSDIRCVEGCAAVVLATPSFAVRTTARQARSHWQDKGRAEKGGPGGIFAGSGGAYKAAGTGLKGDTQKA